MRWVDVGGSPGAGKSTLCDPLWGPHELPIVDGLPPVAWQDFLNEIGRLFMLLDKHKCPTLTAAVRMNNRSIRKIATVSRNADWSRTYVQTGLVQRGLGFGWRMADVGIDLNELRHYFRLMPISVGVAFVEADLETITHRNHERLKDPATRHENRDFMVPLMLPAIKLAKEVLRERGANIIEIDVQNQSPAKARSELVKFATKKIGDTEAFGLGHQVPVLSAPFWWT